MTTIDDILKIYRESICSEYYKGTRFEILMKNFLLTYAPYRGKFSNVWLWKNFPYKNQLGGKDLGIDLVAKTFDENFVAVQCKFYSENTTVEKSAVDSFISASGNDRKFFVDGVEKIFSERIWISTTENYSKNAEEMLKNRSPEVKIINLEKLRQAQVNWSLLNNGFFGENAKKKSRRLPGFFLYKILFCKWNIQFFKNFYELIQNIFVTVIFHFQPTNT